MKNHHTGLHHISVIAGDPQRNAEFYVHVLGMRLVKKSVNQDDPGTYHLFYGNANGDPGSGLTFFPWPMARQGKPGAGEAVKVALSVPENSLEFWAKHLSEKGVDFDGPYDRFGQQAIGFKDPDGLNLELVLDELADEYEAWDGGGVSAEYGIRGFRGTTLRLAEAEPTATLLSTLFGYEEMSRSGRSVFYSVGAPLGGSVIIEEDREPYPVNGRGTVHHIAFRARDREDLRRLREKVLHLGLHPTEEIDRHWFYSVYFRTPGGVLFELATDGPGYAVDEDPDKLGQKLILPPWLEPRRAQIKMRLPEIDI